MGQAAVDYVIDFIHGLSEAPARNVEGALEAALALKASPPEEGGSFEEVFAQFRDAAARAYETCGPGLPAVRPGRRSVRLGPRAVPGDGREPLPEPVGGRPGARADRAERDPMALRPLRLPGGGARHPHDRRLDREPVGGRHGAPREARGGLRRRHLLRERAGARLGPEGGRDRGHAAPRDAARPRRRGAADGRRGAQVDGGRGPGRRAPAVPRRPRRGDHEHRRDRSDGRGGRRRGGRGPLDARRRRVRRLLPSHRAGSGALPRDRARRLDHARPPQGDVPSLRDGLPRGARRRRAPRRPLRRRRVPPGPSARGGAAQLERVLAGAVEGPSGLPRVAAARPARRGSVPAGAGREARPRGAPVRRARRDPRDRAALAAAALRGAVPAPGGHRRRGPGLPRADQRARARVPVQHDDRGPPHHPGVHRQPPHASRPDRRGDRDHPSQLAPRPRSLD